MNDYIETRQEAIEAIKKAINDKWNPICYGYLGDLPDCALCDLVEMEGWGCQNCPLGRRYKVEEGVCCYKYKLWRRNVQGCVSGWSFIIEGYSPKYAEAMLEALVMLLPPEHRKEFEG